MCIIIAKDKNGRIPTEEELFNSFEYNSDGGGFMYTDNGKVIIDKGYMTYKSFISHYKKLIKKYNNFENKSLVIHCRIGTSGKNTKGNTHPYPITDSTRELRTRYLAKDIGIVHNGIIRDYGTLDGLNDTQEYIINFLYPIYESCKTFYKNEKLRNGIAKMTSSKFAILDSEDNIYYIGDFINDNGLNFSNDTYRPYYLSYSNYNYTNDDWYYQAKEKQDNEDYINDDYMFPLESTWYVDLYNNGNVNLVGSRDLWYDWETMSIYERVDNNFKILSNYTTIYDENFDQIG